MWLKSVVDPENITTAFGVCHWCLNSDVDAKGYAEIAGRFWECPSERDTDNFLDKCNGTNLIYCACSCHIRLDHPIGVGEWARGDRALQLRDDPKARLRFRTRRGCLTRMEQRWKRTRGLREIHAKRWAILASQRECGKRGERWMKSCQAHYL